MTSTAPNATNARRAEMRSPWRFFPYASVAALGLVVVVNGYMAWSALSTFPGNAVVDDFGTSNRYDKVLETAERQAALGWVVTATLEGGRPVLRLAGHDGAPLTRATVTATVQRPLGPPEQSNPVFADQGGGLYRSDVALPEQGQWELRLRIEQGGHSYTATRRVVLK
jgi:nitrogen fixation protein FixH